MNTILNRASMSWMNLDPEAQDDPVEFHLDDGTVMLYYPSDMSLYERDGRDHPVKRVFPPTPPQIPGRIHPETVCLVVSNACNFRCSYCYVMDQGRGIPEDSHESRSSAMDDRTVCRAIDLCGGSQVDLRFFGGEPLMAWKSIVWAVERAEAKATVLRQQKPRFHVTTNGYLLDERKLLFLKKHGFTILISVDGPADIHDAVRRTAFGAPTYERVRESLELIKKLDLWRVTSIRATFTPEVLEIQRRLEHLNDLCDQGYADGVSLEPALGCGCSMWCAGSASYEKDVLARTVREASDWCVQRTRGGRTARWSYLNITLRRLVLRQPGFTECGAGSGYIAVTPDGVIWSCHRCSAKIGQLPKGIDVDSASPWIENRLSAVEKCSSCWARYLCGGGCRAEGFEESGMITPGASICMISLLRSEEAIRVASILRKEPEALASLSMTGGL